MTPDQITYHPAPQRDRVMTIESLFGLVGAPAGWFMQLCVGYGFSSTPCFANRERMSSLGAAHEWDWYAMLIATIAGLVIGLLALLVSTRILRRTKDEADGNHADLMEVGSGRTRFLALWGVCVSTGFSLVTLLTFVAYVALPRCVG